MAGQPWTLLNYAFRPFFLLGGLFALLAMLLWVVGLHAGPWTGALPDLVLWHAHEMLIGFSVGSVAGFLLTAVATWTNRPQICGTPLGALVACWLLGRLAMLGAGNLPALIVIAADMAFPLLFAALGTREIVSGKSERNYIIAAIAIALAILNLAFHLGWTGVLPGADRTALYLSVHAILILIAVIGGRIVPSFTANWLRMRGALEMPLIRPWLEKLLIPAMVLAGLADGLMPGTTLAGVLALAAAAVHALRLSSWYGLKTFSEPLLAVLHVAYAWLFIGYALLGLAALGLPITRSGALHALTMGAVGNMVLGVATRVALGHTGRPLAAARPIVAAYVIFTLAVLVRVLSPVAGAWTLRLIDLAATGWLAAFAIFVWVYWPILTRPRIDGRPERRNAT
jgi:uncharacterized protein involved in response to NO